MLLIFSNPRRIIRLNNILKYSEQLASDIEECYVRFMSNKSKWKKSEQTIALQIKYITSNFEKLNEILHPPSLEVLLEQGLSALRNDTVWVHLEYAAINTCKRLGNRVKNAFMTLARLLNDDIDLLPPSKIDLKGYVTDIAKIYYASVLIFNQYRDFLFHLVDSNRSQKNLRDIKASTHATLTKLIKNSKHKELLAKHGLSAFIKNPDILLDASKIKNYKLNHFQLMLSHFDSKIFEQKKILAKGKHEIDFTELYRISKALYKDIEQYSKVIGYSVSSHLKSNSVRDKFYAFKRALPTLQTALASELNEALLSDGLKAILYNSGTLKSLHDDPDFPNWMFLQVHEICSCVYPNITPELNSFRDNLLSFPKVNGNRDLLSDFSSIKAISNALYTDFADFLESCKVNIEQLDYSMVSVYHNYQQVKSLLNKYSCTFSHKHLEILRQYGIRGFGIEGGLVQNHLLAELQSSVHNSSFNRTTAITYRSSLSWFMREFDIPFNNIYPIKLTKTVKHKQRLNTDDFYTEHQCRELAFYTEKLLRDDSTSLYHRILLTFGKVILKTGWNVSPLLKLECDDIVEVESPITNKTEYAVVLQKAKAGYRNDTFTFSKPELKAGALKSAISDLLIIRDELTASLRPQTRHGNFLFIYSRNGNIFKLEYTSVKLLSTVLMNAGCTIPFVAQKIRKGGVNHIYRNVSKSIKKYTDTINHSFETFESNYLRINPDQSRYSLSQAIKVMADYFTGKEISTDIHIITDTTASKHQIIPTGTCAAIGHNEEAERYDREHRKLHQNNHGSNQKTCADFLSCIWCKYFRIVVDAEHVWKLLSYRDYILQNMEMSVLDFEDTHNQNTNLNILKQRVDDIIASLRERNSEAVAEGFVLIDKQGMHPDWEFANPSTSSIKGKI